MKYLIFTIFIQIYPNYLFCQSSHKYKGWLVLFNNEQVCIPIKPGEKKINASSFFDCQKRLNGFDVAHSSVNLCLLKMQSKRYLIEIYGGMTDTMYVLPVIFETMSKDYSQNPALKERNKAVIYEFRHNNKVHEVGFNIFDSIKTTRIHPYLKIDRRQIKHKECDEYYGP
ncbi:hypothetical protein A8C56_02830 [Niabella ginsenosidivorans]|uniref:Uncharacterized protein n=1 Tax=Niabella ginsenosidivorans TaxID=1176587 RepID=A0A1A9HXB9_9BACT|nr:hypothetical protein [Niabella ginsenosidivorans]ANH80058.1 hypothetical protein A8C56_02830 [Niabella ginsenosidivorans]